MGDQRESCPHQSPQTTILNLLFIIIIITTTTTIIISKLDLLIIELYDDVYKCGSAN